jgi:hypothetical protein
MTRIAVCGVWLAVLSLPIANTVRADPINITGGTFLVTGRGVPNPVVLQGTRGFSLNAIADVSEISVHIVTQCLPACEPGTTLSLRGGLGSSGLGGTATFEGVTYTYGFGNDPEAGIGINMDGSTAMPPVADQSVTFRAPFTFGGVFRPPFPQGTAEIAAGSGIATIVLAPIQLGGTDLWTFERILYDFGPQPAPVPEPASLTLLGVGVVATIARARRQRRSGERVLTSLHNVQTNRDSNVVSP